MVRGPAPPRILSTYRLQLHAGFSLSRVRELVPYLDRLGVTHLHLSPLLRARSGSQHGYDVVDPTTLNPEIGTEDDLEQLVAQLRRRDMGLVLDIVPNHMAASSENWRWEDVLAHGFTSPYARWFDIEWRVGDRDLHSRVLLPLLGDLRSWVVERGELGVVLIGGDLRVRYYDHSLPLDPSTYPLVLQRAWEECERDLGAQHAGTLELQDILLLLRRMPRRGTRGAKAIARRRRLAGEAMRRLRKLCALTPEVRRRIERAATWYTADRAGAARMNRLLEAQAYRLVYWRRAAREINYRRFFDVNDLIALHMEDPEVFAQTHSLVLDWLRAGYIDGFRIDHPDGLLDPSGYLRRLAGAAFADAGSAHPPIWVEKILSGEEPLRDEWPVAGSTGYDFLNQAEAIFLDPAGAAQVERDYQRIVRRPVGFGAVALGGKRRSLQTGLSAGVRRLAYRLQRLAGRGGPLAPLPLHVLAGAIIEVIVHLPVYRTYVDDRGEPAGVDRALLEQGLAGARTRGRASPAALDILAGALLGTDPAMRTGEHEGLRRRFVQRFQQVSGPATAKGVEDTAFYVHVPLLSRNEVGGDPEMPLAAADQRLHRANAHRAACWPASMLAVTTHDTKRSADVRARLDVLSEIPDEWEERLYRWRRWNRPHRGMIRGQLLPDANTEYLVYQTLVGAWPLELVRPNGAEGLRREDLIELRDRIAAYALKAAREAKVETSWLDPDAEFEGALDRFVTAMLSPEESPEFVADMARFAGRVARPGFWNSLARVLLQLTSPGMPDTYQGDELWNFVLVDPDNRRPVDFGRRQALLDDVIAGFAADAPARRSFLRELIERPEDGRIKLHLITRLLQARRLVPEVFFDGDYEPLAVVGPRSEQAFAYLRRGASSAAVVALPRLVTRDLAAPHYLPLAAAAWTGTRLVLPPGLSEARWENPLTGDVEGAGDTGLDLGALFKLLPGALLLLATG